MRTQQKLYEIIVISLLLVISDFKVEKYFYYPSREKHKTRFKLFMWPFSVTNDMCPLPTLSVSGPASFL